MSEMQQAQKKNCRRVKEKKGCDISEEAASSLLGAAMSDVSNTIVINSSDSNSSSVSQQAFD